MSCHPPGIVFWTFWARAPDVVDANGATGGLETLYKIFVTELELVYT